MVWLLIIVGVLGPAVAGHFDDEESCKKAGIQLIALLEEEGRGPPKAMGCADFPGGELPTPETEYREARWSGTS